MCDQVATYTSTKAGAMACRQLSPWLTRDQTENRLTQTAEALLLDQEGLSLQGIYDIEAYLDHVAVGGVLQGAELQQIASTLKVARKIRRQIDDFEATPVLQDLIDTIRTYPEIEHSIFQSLEEDGSVRDTASETLRQIRLSLKDIRSTIQTRLQRLLSEQSYAIQESVITQREGRYVIPVKATHKDVIRGLVHDTSSTGATLYLEPYSVVKDNNQLRQWQGRAKAEENRIFRALSAQVAAVIPDLKHLQAVLVELDLALARARYSLWLEGNQPRFVQGGLNLRQVRHPLLLWQCQHEEQHTVIPVDFRLRSDVHVVVITGPNTGGKTVTLKTLGLLVLMAKSGLYLPARDPVEIPWFDQVLADMGDEQSLQQSLSTFSGHIRRISRILHQVNAHLSSSESDGLVSADPESVKIERQPALVLLDEVGAGTDPTEGAALATALLHYLAQHALLTIATTHYGELKSLKYQQAYFENASVEFDEATLAPTYRLLWGIPGRSNALTIAERLQLDPTIVQLARQHLQGHTDDVNAVIMGLERQRAELDAKTQQVETLHRELEVLQQDMLQRSQQIATREAALNEAKTQSIQSEIQSAKDKVAAVVRRLQKGDPTVQAQAAQQASAELAKLEQQHAQKPAPAETEFYPAVGDRIRLQGLNQTGEIIAINGDDFSVRSGMLKFTVGLHQLAPLDESQAKKRQRPKPPQVAMPTPQTAPLNIRTRQNTVDLRGRTVADAELMMEKMIAEAPAGPLWLLHGHGTGRLRQGVHQYLRTHPRVSSFTAAEAEEGGTGVTVAQIR